MLNAAPGFPNSATIAWNNCASVFISAGRNVRVERFWLERPIVVNADLAVACVGDVDHALRRTRNGSPQLHRKRESQHHVNG
jgi:hypothetical protein